MRDRVCAILGSRYPLLLGPMRLITLGELAAAVSLSGGFGQVAASGLPGQRLRAELARARELTDRPVGVNVPLYRANAVEALEIAAEAGVRTVTTSAGDPAKVMGRIRALGLRVIHKVSTVGMGRKAEDAGVDAVVATGFEAGGHVGRAGITTLSLVPQLADALKIPVIAAGAVADARGFLAALALGAEGVEVGTRFLATHECPISGECKEAVLRAGCDATTVVGKRAMPLRILRNEAAERIAAGGEEEEDRRLAAAGEEDYAQAAGGMGGAILPCGQIAGLIQEIVEAKSVVPGMVTAAARLARELAKRFDGEVP